MKLNATRFSFVLFALLVRGISSIAAEADTYAHNWPQWRGPAGNGLVLHGNPPTEWAENKNIKWKVRLPGRGHATPIIWENKIFVLTAVPLGQPAGQPGEAAPPPPGEAPAPDRSREGRGPRGPGGRGGQPDVEQAFTTFCLDARTGKVLWEKVSRKEKPHQGIHPSNTHSSGSPVTDGENLYVSFGSHGLYCYDLNGNMVWEKDLGKVNVTFGEGSSPALSGNTLLVVQYNNADSSLYALDKKTGKELWKQKRAEPSTWTTPFILKHGGKTQVVLNSSEAVRSYDLATGDLLWECAGFGSSSAPTVVADDERVYAMSGPAGMAMKLGRSGVLTGTDAVVWKIDRGTPYVPSPLLYDGLLFFCQRTAAIASCLDAATGTPHYAQERLKGISGVYASPIGVNNRIYLLGQDGAGVVIEKSKELKILATNKLDDGFTASPAVVGNQLFLRGRNHLYCIEENRH